MPDTPGPRFLKLSDAAEELAMSQNQVYALVRRGDIEAVKIGGRGQWRIERVKFEEYIAKTYEETRQFIKDNPLPQEAEQDARPREQRDEHAAAEPPAGREASIDRSHDDVTALAAMSNPRPPAAAVSAAGGPQPPAQPSGVAKEAEPSGTEAGL
ncbi:helix-turn-helix domain-containing protein [Kribbella sp. NPDC048928]|uniref:helix-turn-helix domain-containing protein n=1 Tax=Kribbella sp. NPDC048928 TaxID=3364111 RepID=UPI0037132665